jgi:hypothetical protein
VRTVRYTHFSLEFFEVGVSQLQAKWVSRSARSCTGNPLQCLLQDAVFGTRGTGATGIWGAQLIDFFVAAEG